MPHGSASVVIGRSIEDVLRVLSDVEKTPSWYPETIEERMAPLASDREDSP